MKDLNFFEPYIEKRQLKFDKMFILYGLLILSIIAISVYGVYNQLQISSLSADVLDRKAIAENPTTIAKVDEIKALEAEVSTFRDEVNKIIELDKSIEAKDIIGEELLKKIKTKMPSDLFLTNFNAYEREIQLSGIAKDTYSIAEFGKGLEQIEEAESTFVSNITNTEDYYNFVLNLTLKDVTIDGNQPNQE